MYFISRATGDKKAGETGFLGAEVIAHTQIITLVLKSATHGASRDAKDETSAERRFWRGGDSFPRDTPPVRLGSRRYSRTNTANNT